MKIIFIVIVTLVSCLVFANSGKIALSQSVTSVDIISADEHGLKLNYRIDRIGFFEVQTDLGPFTEIYVEHYASTNLLGEPKLPMNRRFITAPMEADLEIKNLTYQSKIIDLASVGLTSRIIPLQPSVAKCPDAEIPPFELNIKTYNSSDFIEFPLVELEEIGILRGNRLIAVNVYPFSYNPIEEELKVFNDVNFEVEFINGNILRTQNQREKTYSPYFEPILNRFLMNYSPLDSRDDLTNYPISYVIISDPMFEGQLQPFIEWKTQKGFNVIEGYTDQPEIGNTTNSIKNFLQSIYDSATPQNPAPSFVLFVGDIAQIPSFSGNTGNHVTDLHYVRLDGTDYLPDMYYGRFSANNFAELQPQIDKTLFYERLETEDPSYLAESVLIAGHDNFWASSHGNGHINYGTEHYFNASNGSYPHVYLYPQSSSSAQQIISNVSNGVGYINYTAHGSPVSWADPSFTISDINNLQNYGKYSMVVGNCCITNKFDIYECFGEAWLRAENKGAIGYIGGNDNTYWNEDYWWGVGYVASIPNHGNALPFESTGPGMFDGLFHTHGEEFINWYTTGGAIILAGNLAVEMSNSHRKNYYWEIYSLMGDPSLTPYMREPLENQSVFPQVVVMGLDTIQVFAEPYSYVGLSKNGVLHGAGVVGETGLLNLQFDPFLEPGSANLVITLQNHEPIIEEIEVVPSEGAFLILDSFEVNSSVYGNQAVYGDNISFDINIRNVGFENTEYITVVLTSDEEYMQIIDGLLEIDLIESEETISFENVFSIQLASNIPDQHQLDFDLVMTDSEGNSWQSGFNIFVNAPNFIVEEILVIDSGENANNQLDPGESALILITTLNNGSALSPYTNVHLFSQSEYVVIQSASSLEAGYLEPGGYVNLPFSVSVSEDIPNASSVNFGYMISSGEYISQHSFYLPVGTIYEDFSSGDFDSYNWQFSGNQPWFIDSTQSQQGNFSARSGQIGHNQTSHMYITMDVASDSEISFYKLVSSENNYDFLRFYINDQLQDQWSGTNDSWSRHSYEVLAGTNTFRWVYSKDGSVSHGSDCAWIDYIVFPASGHACDGPLMVSLDESIDFGYTITGNFSMNDFVVYNLGPGILTGTIETSDNFFIQEENIYEYEFIVLPFSQESFQLIFYPVDAINYTGELTITGNDLNDPEYIINLQGDGFDAPVPENLQALLDIGSVSLQWDAIDLRPLERSSEEKTSALTRNDNADVYLLGYNVYRDDTQINIDIIEDNFYLDGDVEDLKLYVYYVTAVYNIGESGMSKKINVKTLDTEDVTIEVVRTELSSNYPNPFNPETLINFSVKDGTFVNIDIYNIVGQKVKTLVNEFKEQGHYQTIWNGKNSTGQDVSSGIYFYRMRTDNYESIKKMMLLK